MYCEARIDLLCLTAPFDDAWEQIVGFTAWSSMREPTHVFQLLESVYHEFDKIATQQKIFKVETMYVFVSLVSNGCAENG